MKEKEMNLSIFELSPNDVMDIRAMLETGASKEEVLDIFLSKGFEQDRVHYYVNDMSRIISKNKQIRKDDFRVPLAHVIYAFGISLVIILFILSFENGHRAIFPAIVTASVVAILFIVRVIIQYYKEKKNK